MGPDFVVVVLVIIVLLGISVIGGVLGAVALVTVNGLKKEVALLRAALWTARTGQAAAVAPVVPTAPVAPAPPSPPFAPASSSAIFPTSPAPPTAPAVAASGGAGGSGTYGLRPPLPAVSPGLAPADMGSLESRIGQRWIAWVGAVVVFFSGVFFLKHAFDNDWIGPTGQVVICALGGAVMLATGSRFVAKRWRMLGQSLMGLGLAILYATFYAAASIYNPHVMTPEAAFACMIGVTAAGMALAIMHDAVAIAFLAVLGGILTPVLVSTGKDARDALFTYLMLLDLGVLAVAFFRGWRLLDALAMVGTFALYAAWYASFYTAAALGPALGWLGGFYVVFLVLPFVYHLVRRENVSIERFVMALANAGLFAIYAWEMLRAEYLFSMGFVALGMAAAYLVLGALIRRRLPGDNRAVFGLLAMTVTFLTLAVPMQLRAHGILLAWVAEAPILAYLAYRYRYLPVRVFAAAILVLGVGRLYFYHWPLHDELFIPFLSRPFLSAMAVPAAAAAYALVHWRFRAAATTLDRGLQVAAGIGAGFLTLIIVSAETGGWLSNDVNAYTADAAVTALWAVGALGYLVAGARTREAMPWVWAGGALVLLIAVVLNWINFGDDRGAGHILLLNVRFGAGLMAAVAALGYAYVIGRRGEGAGSRAGVMGVVFLAAGLLCLLVLLSAEVYTFCTDVMREDYTGARRAGQMGITSVWSVYAIGLLFVGFWRRWRSVRVAGLALFGLAALKLVVLDLTFLKDVSRIVSFLVLGMLMLAASYLYHRLEKRLAARTTDGPGASAAVGGGQP